MQRKPELKKKKHFLVTKDKIKWKGHEFIKCVDIFFNFTVKFVTFKSQSSS